MLSLSGPLGPTTITRREMLRLGGLAVGGLALPQLLSRQAQAGSGRKPRAKSCLLVFMEGGPSHIDLWDMKPAAPEEVRGGFKPVATSLPGLQVCEHLPRLGRQMHRLTLVRSVTHSITDHNAGSYLALTGRDPVDGSRLIVKNSPTNFPCFGSVLAKLRPTGRALPDFVHLPEYQLNNGADIPGQQAGFLGTAYDPFVAGDPSLPDYQIPGLEARAEVPRERLGRRQSLLKQLEQLGDGPALQGTDAFVAQAFRLISSPEVRRAFDLSQEPRSLRERYGIDQGSDRSVEARKFGGLPHLGQCLLLARRLIEAGVRLVTVVTGRRIDQAWDTHRDHFGLLKQSLCPYFDAAFGTLLEDLATRGMLDETLVVCMGEFGRTPKLGQITSGAGATKNGRDHWPKCYSAMFAGAGVPAGAVFGSSDAHGAYPKENPVTPADLAATIYRLMGLDPATEIHDPQGRPFALALGQPINALLG